MVIFEKAPAKINLSLDVLGKRPDGYHEVETVMSTIDLSDRIELIPLDEDVIKVSLDSRYVPNDKRNSAYQAAQLMKDTYQIKAGVLIKMEKDIPVSAGLGGGSSDAAAVLRGLNKLWDLNIPIEELAQLSLQVGSDVPFCVMNETSLVKGRGEIISKLPKPPTCWVVLAKPNIGVSTRKIFEKVNVQQLSHPQTDVIIQALYEQDFHTLQNNLGNSLEDVTLNIYPQIKQLKQKMLQVGAAHVIMSGSGGTIYCLEKNDQRAQRIYNGLRGFCKEVYKVRLLS